MLCCYAELCLLSVLLAQDVKGMTENRTSSRVGGIVGRISLYLQRLSLGIEAKNYLMKQSQIVSGLFGAFLFEMITKNFWIRSGQKSSIC